MFIAILQTQRGELRQETDTFEKAWAFLCLHSETVRNIVRAVVLEDVRWSDGHYLYPNREVASMRIIR